MEYQNVICKIRPNETGLTNILGIKYEIFNVGGVQYGDNNGNGLFYSFDNYPVECALNKKEKISLKSIKISPEISLLELKILDQNDNMSDSIDLYENQYYNFNFMLENIGNYPINNLLISYQTILSYQ